MPRYILEKADIIKWLENKGEVVDHTKVKSQLLERVQVLKPQYGQYVIDELAKAANKTVVRLPPYHCELNPIELTWSSVKNYVHMNNTTYKLQDVRKLLEEGVERVTPDMWKNFITHVKKEEDKFWPIDVLSDELFDEQESHILTITGDTSSDFDSD